MYVYAQSCVYLHVALGAMHDARTERITMSCIYMYVTSVRYNLYCYVNCMQKYFMYVRWWFSSVCRCVIRYHC